MYTAGVIVGFIITLIASCIAVVTTKYNAPALEHFRRGAKAFGIGFISSLLWPLALIVVVIYGVIAAIRDHLKPPSQRPLKAPRV